MSIVTDAMRRIDSVQRRHAALAFPVAVFKKFGEDRGGRLASLIAYYGFFSLFPLLLVFVAVLGFLLGDNPQLQRDILDSTLANFPIIGDQIRSNIGSLSGNGFALAIGLAGALWAGMGAIRATQTAMDDLWSVPRERRPNLIGSAVRSLVMLTVLGTFAVLAAIIPTLGSAFGTGFGLRVAGIALTLLVNFGLFMVVFKVLTVAKVSWRDVTPGAALAAVVWSILHSIGGWYLGSRLEGASQVYGFFAIVIGLLAWIALAAQVTLLAAETNVVRIRGLWPRALSEERVGGQKEGPDASVRPFVKPDRSGAMETANNNRTSTPQLVRSIADDTRTLVQKEIELARHEIVEAVLARIKGGVAFIGAGIMMLFVLVFAGSSIAHALEGRMSAWAARLIVAAGFLVLAVGAALFGKMRMSKPAIAPEETKRTVKEDIEWAKAQLKR
ncbi:MAG TPA: YhjD/YihY/BrkB family envelope integrity protein [Actinomycetota bacterium]|nr:YhjD/YihY/BrkB family envelope integrity protein [Actinomycetota bacterium]